MGWIMRKSVFLAFLVSAVTVCATSAVASAQSPAQYVNVFIGTAPTLNGHFGFDGNSGDVFPGADTPFGMVQFSPDTASRKRRGTIPGGYYYPDHRISGFSLDHYSGRGCTYMEDFGFLPLSGAVSPGAPADPGNVTVQFTHQDEQASPGYYSVVLHGGVRVELTTTPRSGMARFTFPKGDRRGSVLINVTHSVRGALASSVKFVSSKEVAGWVETRIGCGRPTYHAYFDAVFSRPHAASGVWKSSQVIPGGTSSGGQAAGAYVTFNTSVHHKVLMKVGLSYVSIANARLNRKSENPGWGFGRIRRHAQALWTRALSRVVVHGGSRTEKTIFYTELYRCVFEPSLFDDANGQYLGFDDRVHQLPKGHNQYDNISGWDFYRSDASLLGFLFPHVASDIAQSLVNDARQDKGGGIPRWEQINRNSNGMLGDGNVPLIANIYAFGGRDFDLHAALKAMLRNALVVGTKSDGYNVRNHLSGYLRRGWVAQHNHDHSAATTLEYAAADFAAAQFARANGDAHAAKVLEAHAANWLNLFDPHTGYLQPRDTDGQWPPDKPQSDVGWAEGSTAQYTWMAPFDIPALIARMGGPAAVSKRLNTLFTELNAGPRSIYYYNGNEPDESQPWIYDFIGKPWRTQEVVRRIQNSLWTDSPSGMPGNADGGALPSWYVFSAIGLYPDIPGVGGFVVGSPLFKSIVIHRSGGRTITIQGVNAGPQQPYVKSLTVDGQPDHSLWLPLARLDQQHDSTLRFVLSSRPDKRWDASPIDTPPDFMKP